jgi:hypothetical protein
MNPEEEPMVIVAAAFHNAIIPGSKAVKCGCGTEVWLSPSTQVMIKERGDTPTQIICTSCFSQALKKRFETQLVN